MTRPGRRHEVIVIALRAFYKPREPSYQELGAFFVGMNLD
jgi:hypothetical protein